MKKLPKCLLLALLSVGALSACSSPRGLSHKATRPIADVEIKEQSDQLTNFAKEIAQASEYAVLHMHYTPFGSNLDIKVGSFYVNGLSQKCKKASVEGSSYNMQNFAVCEVEHGTWHYIPALNSDL